MTARGLSPVSSINALDRILGTVTQPSEPVRIPDLDQSQAILREEIRNLDNRLSAMNTSRAYYEGDQSLVFGTPKFRTEVGSAFEDFKDNWVKVVVNAMVDRLYVEGLSINEKLDSDQLAKMDISIEDLQLAIWTIMARNNFDQQQDELHTGVLVEGRGSVIVWPDPIKRAKVDWNPGQNVFVRYDDDREKVLWAVKRWRTPGGMVRVNLYYPDRLEKYLDNSVRPPMSEDEGKTEFSERVPTTGGTNNYQPIELLRNPLGEVPVVEFRNREGSEIRDVIAQQDALNYLMIAALNASGHAGFAQRVMMTNAKEPLGGWKNEPGMVWQLPHTYDPDGNPMESKIGQFPPPDLDKFVNIMQEFLRHVASTSSTPMRFFYQSDRGGRGDASSGEALRVDDEPLIDKVEAAQRRLGNSWYEVFRLVAKAARITSVSPFPVGEPYWKDPQARHRSVLLDDAEKMKRVGIPFEYYIKTLGFSPLEIEEILEARANAEWSKGPGSVEELPEGEIVEMEAEESGEGEGDEGEDDSQPPLTESG